MIHRLRWLLLFGLLLSGVAAAIDPSLEWKTLEGERVRVHFADGYESTAHHALQIAERVQRHLSAELQWLPRDKSELVLSDESDLANGFAQSFPYNRSVLWLAPPDEVESLEDYDDWLDLLISHEAVHLLHLDKADSSPLSLRRLFGRHFLLFPNQFQPAWITEGLATWYETDLERGLGRGQSSYYQMMMRMELESGLKPLSQVNLPIRSWPGGTTRYLYGVHFFQFLQQRYGTEKIKQWLGRYSGNLIPFKVNSSVDAVLSQSMPQLWEEFRVYLQQRYAPQLAALREAGVVSGERLTHEGFNSRQVRAVSGDEAYYLRANDSQPAALMRWTRQGGVELISEQLQRGARFDLHPQAGVLITQPELCEEYGLYYDLYHLNPSSGELRRLSYCQRYRHASWSPDGRQIAVVQQRGAVVSLLLLDAAGDNPQLLWQGEESEVLGQLDWSPDGSWLVAALQRPDHGWNLERFDLQQRRWSALTDDALIETEPQFSPAGDSVLFSSEQGGSYQLRRLNLASGEIETLSRVMGGAFSVSQAGEALFYAGYGVEGFDIYRLVAPQPLVAVNLPSSELNGGGALLRQPVKLDDVAASVSPYSPLSTLMPRWWLPHWVFSSDWLELGLSTSGSDALDEHRYELLLAADLSHGWPVGSIGYAYRNWLLLAASSFSTPQLNSAGELLRLQRNDTLQLVLNLPRTRLQSRWNGLLGVMLNQEADRWLSDSYPVESLPNYNDSLVGAALLFGNSRQYTRSISANDGREVRLIAESSDLLKSGYSGEVYTFDWREYWRLGGQQVLALRYLRAEGSRRARAFQLGGEGRVNLLALSPYDGVFNRRSYPLRGYPEGLPQLSGNRLSLLGAEWRLPIGRVERGIMAPPVGLQQWSVTLFYEQAEVGLKDAVQRYAGAGAELNFDLNLFYGIDFRSRVGYAHGFDQGGEDRLYLTLGTAF